MATDPKTPATLLDATGLRCPLPVLKARKALKSLPPGGTLLVRATDPAAPRDFQAFCTETSHELVETAEKDGVYEFTIRKPA